MRREERRQRKREVCLSSYINNQPREEVVSPSQPHTPIPNIDIESFKRLLPGRGFNVS